MAAQPFAVPPAAKLGISDVGEPPCCANPKAEDGVFRTDIGWTDMSEQENIQKGAREVADLLKDGKTAEAGDRLRDDFKNMSTDEFKAFVKQVDKYNEDDRATNSKLPDITFHETSLEGTTVIQSVDITTPGKVFGNMWRDSETVVDGGLGSGMLAHTETLIQGRNAQLAQAMESFDRTANERVKPIEQQKN